MRDIPVSSFIRCFFFISVFFVGEAKIVIIYSIFLIQFSCLCTCLHRYS